MSRAHCLLLGATNACQEGHVALYHHSRLHGRLQGAKAGYSRSGGVRLLVWFMAAVLLMLYEGLFRLYQQTLLHANNYGMVAVFALVILLFLYYLAFILLLRAEISSWTSGQ